MQEHKDLQASAAVRLHDGEPWVDLADAEELANWRHEHEVAYNQTNRQAEKYRFYIQTFDFLSENRIRGDYFEFGCHRARTFRMALTEARRHDRSEMTFFAFDSFLGLPDHGADHGVPHWTPGELATSEETFRNLVGLHGIYADQIVTISGNYNDSLQPPLQKALLDEGRRIALACIDCDLYESAVPVFSFIEPFLQEGAVIYVDDYFAGYRGSPAKGVARAFRNFRRKSRFKLARHMDVGWWGRSYIAYQDDEDSDDPDE